MTKKELNKLISDIDFVLDYLWYEESRDYRKSESKKDHVFAYIQRIKKTITKQQNGKTKIKIINGNKGKRVVAQPGKK